MLGEEVCGGEGEDVFGGEGEGVCGNAVVKKILSHTCINVHVP